MSKKHSARAARQLNVKIVANITAMTGTLLWVTSRHTCLVYLLSYRHRGDKKRRRQALEIIDVATRKGLGVQ